LKRLIKNESGSTIIEVVVVMSIMAILATVTLSLVTSLFDSSIRTSKYLEQNTKIETLYGFFASRMASTNVGNVGLANTGNTAVDPLTLAGDQFLFSSNGGGSTTGATLCYRVMYFKNAINNGTAQFTANSIWVAVADNCTSIRPTTGPNQSSSTIAASNDPVLDPSSGNPAGSPFVLASDIMSTNSKFSTTAGGPNLCGGASTSKSYTANLVPFAFCNSSLSPVAVASSAAVGASGAFYTPASGTTVSTRLSEIRANQITAYVQSGGSSSSVPIREYAQVFSLAQVCAVETEVDLTLPNPESWRLILPFGQAGATPSFKEYWESASNTNGQEPGFYRDTATKRVYLRGTVKRTVGAPNIGLYSESDPNRAIMFTLPDNVKYRPSGGSQIFLVPRGTAGGTATIEIGTNGNVSFVGASNSGANTGSEIIYLDTISFRADTP
jgi:hypothetical protein